MLLSRRILSPLQIGEHYLLPYSNIYRLLRVPRGLELFHPTAESCVVRASELFCGSTLAFSQRVALSPRVLYKDLAHNCKPGKKNPSAEPGLEQKARGHLPPNKAKEIPALHQSGINRS